MINKIQEFLIKGLEKSFDKPYNKPLQKLMLIPGPTSPHERLRIGRYTQSTLLLFSAMVLIFFLGLVIYVLYLWSDRNALAYLLKHLRVELILAFAAVRWHLLVILAVVPLSTFWYIATLYPSVWAWNRRADRLNREAAAPQAVPAALPGVWPPPPTRN